MHLPGRYIDFRTLVPPLLQEEIPIGFPIRFRFREALLSPIGEILFKKSAQGKELAVPPPECGRAPTTNSKSADCRNLGAA